MAPNQETISTHKSWIEIIHIPTMILTIGALIALIGLTQLWSVKLSGGGTPGMADWTGGVVFLSATITFALTLRSYSRWTAFVGGSVVIALPVYRYFEPLPPMAIVETADPVIQPAFGLFITMVGGLVMILSILFSYNVFID